MYNRQKNAWRKMIKVHPDSDLSLNIVVLGAELITLLKNNKNKVNTETLMKEFIKCDIKRTPELFIDAVVFLFLVNIIKYQSYNIILNK